LSTIPAIGGCVLGLLTGKWLRSARSGGYKALGMTVAGVIFIAVGRTWHLWFPINKKLWTSSFVLFTAGIALVGLAVCYWLVDVKQFRRGWTTPILVFGKNAIAAYVFSEVLASSLYAIRFGAGPQSTTLQGYLYTHLFAPLASAANACLAYSLAYVFLCWLVMAILYRRAIFLKV
jgi:predicted acyltransferase